MRTPSILFLCFLSLTDAENFQIRSKITLKDVKHEIQDPNQAITDELTKLFCDAELKFDGAETCNVSLAGMLRKQTLKLIY